MLNKTQNNLLLINGVLLMLFVCILGHLYRLVPEDYYAVTGNLKYGPWLQMKQVCNTWGGRYFSYYFSFIILDLHQHGFSFAWYYLAGNLILLFSFYAILSSLTIFQNNFKDKKERIGLSFLFFMMLFYLTPGIRESWFWTGASTSYYWGLVMAVAGWALLLKNNSTWFHVIGSGFCFLYTGSASEPFALMNLLFLLLYFIFNIKKKKPGFLIPFSIVILLAFAGFLLMITAQGTANRWMAMPALSLHVMAIRWAGAVAIYFLHWFPQMIFTSLFFAPIILAIGTRFEFQINNRELKSDKKLILIRISVYVVIIALSFLPAAFVMGEAGPLRSWHHMGIYTVILFFLLFAFAGFHFRDRIIPTGKLLTPYLVIVTCLHAGYLFWQTNKTIRYAHAVDARIEKLNRLKTDQNLHTVSLERLPDSGYLFSAEIGSDSSYYLNLFLKQGLDLPFDVYVKPADNKAN